MPGLVTCKFEEDSIKNEGTIVSTTFFPALMLIDGCDRNSKFSEIFWLSWLPASLIMTRSKLKALLCPQHFLHYKFEVYGKIFGAQGQVTPNRIV